MAFSLCDTERSRPPPGPADHERRWQEAVAAGVRHSVGHWFPHNFYSLCHAFAVVGSNLASIASGRDYRPVAGHAAIDAGNGKLIVMNEDHAFGAKEGGAYHCWIESTQSEPKELIDLTFGHNHLYAQANGYAWHGEEAPAFLWGPFDAIAITAPLSHVQPGFGKDRIWLRETRAGAQWMERHIAANEQAYVKLTTEALCHYRDLTLQA